MSWDYYNALCRSDPSVIALEEGAVSTKIEDIDTYLKKAAKKRYADLRVIPEKPPEPLNTALKLQARDGKWNNLDDIKDLFRISEFAPSIGQTVLDCATPWQEATALVVAAMRQKYEYFHLLGDAYDLAYPWISEEMIWAARDILLEYTDPPEVSIASDDFEAREARLLKRRTKLFARSQTSSPVVVHVADKLEEEDLFDDSTSSPNLRRSSSGLADQLRALTPQVDKRRTEMLQNKIEAAEMDIVDQFILIEEYLKEVKSCLEIAVKLYKESEVLADRNIVFNELTARLGEGFPGQVGFTDWREKGVPSYRNMVVDFLISIFELAQLRLELAEAMAPEGRQVRGKGSSAEAEAHRVMSETKARYSLIWDEEDIVHKVLHSLDFLRKCWEIGQWYGRTYSFIANPMSFPFNCKIAADSLQMHDIVQEYLATEPHYRRVKYGEGDWQYDKYLSTWGKTFMDMSSNRWDCWPDLPDLREDFVQKRLYTAMLVLLIKCSESIGVCAASEKKMVTQLGTLRGLQFYFKGEVKPAKMTTLELPQRVEKKPLELPSVTKVKKENSLTSLLKSSLKAPHAVKTNVLAPIDVLNPSPISSKGKTSPTSNPLNSNQRVSMKTLSAKVDMKWATKHEAVASATSTPLPKGSNSDSVKPSALIKASQETKVEKPSSADKKVRRKKKSRSRPSTAEEKGVPKKEDIMTEIMRSRKVTHTTPLNADKKLTRKIKPSDAIL